MLRIGEVHEATNPCRRVWLEFRTFGADRSACHILVSPCRWEVALCGRTRGICSGTNGEARSRSPLVGLHGPLASPARQSQDLSLVDVCRSFETVELWFDPAPNDQLQLVWLLDLLSSHPEVVAKLKVRLVDFDLLMAKPEELARWKVPAVEVTESEIETASMAWQAYRSATPEACFDLLAKDLSALPLLRPALLDLLEELPSYATGLGATEMRLLELIARGYTLTNALFYLSSIRLRRVFNTREIGFLLEGLAHGPNPAIAGLDSELRTLDKETERGRDEAYRRSFLSLTELGWAIVEHKEDFSRYNPIDRWWGGTRLTNDCLWHWNPALVAPQPSRRLSTFVPGPKTHPSREPF